MLWADNTVKKAVRAARVGKVNCCQAVFAASMMISGFEDMRVCAIQWRYDTAIQ
jgi:hypothetical protein